MDETHFQVGLHHKLEKEKTKCDTEWRSMRGNNEGLNFPLPFGKKNSLGSIIGPLELFGNYWEVWVGNCGRQMENLMYNVQCRRSQTLRLHEK